MIPVRRAHSLTPPRLFFWVGMVLQPDNLKSLKSQVETCNLTKG